MSINQQIRYKIVVCVIVTRKYHIFAQRLISGLCTYFLLKHDVEVHMFTDDIEKFYLGDDRVTIVKHKVASYGFPEATLLRYHMMTSVKYDCDYIYYLDIDYAIVDDIKEEFLGNIVAVLHPGFAVVGGGSWCDDKNSKAYTLPENRKKYYCGGTAGGRKEIYYNIMEQLRDAIEDDRKRGVKAEWNDEAHWNRYLSEINNFKELDSSYCMVEQMHLRKLWKINNLEPKILALEKQHELIRN